MVGYMFIVNCERMFLLNAPFVSDSYVAVYWSVCPSYVAVYWSVCTKLFLTPGLDNNELDPVNISEHLKYAENKIFF